MSDPCRCREFVCEHRLAQALGQARHRLAQALGQARHRLDLRGMLRKTYGEGLTWKKMLTGDDNE